jgi:hypothetical protein
MQLDARKGNLKGIARILAQRDQTINIVLAAAPVVSNRPAKSSSKAKLCEVTVDGLKILRSCP